MPAELSTNLEPHTGPTRSLSRTITGLSDGSPAGELHEASLTVAIIATNGPGTVGGLAAYLRGLVQALEVAKPIPCVVRFNRRGRVELSYATRESRRVDVTQETRVTVVSPARFALPILRLSRRLMFYRPTRSIARRLFSLAFHRQLNEAIPAKVDLVHIIGTGWEMLGPAMLPTLRRRGAAVTALPAIHPGTWGDSEFDVEFYSRLDAVLALSQYERNRLVELGVPADRVHVCGLAPAIGATGDGERFRTKHGLAHRPIVLFVGRKQSYKGYHALISAVELARTEIPDLCLVTVGPGSDKADPHGAKDLHLDLGACDDATKADALAACDVFCMPSAAESFGLAFVEAWSLAKPVIGGPAPAVRELISEDVDGFSCEQTPAELARALTRLMGDATLRRRLGEAGHTRQLESFTWTAVAARHQEIFAAAIQQRNAGTPASCPRRRPFLQRGSAI